MWDNMDYSKYAWRNPMNYEDTNFTSFNITQDHEDRVIAEWANGKSSYDAKQNFMTHEKTWLNDFAITFEKWAKNR